jgi:hypothetical protein
MAAEPPSAIFPMRADLSVPADIEQLIAGVKSRWPDLSLLINNAAMQMPMEFAGGGAAIPAPAIFDEPFMRARFAGKPDGFFVKPDDIADTAVMLTRQRPSAWSFELEARPFGEPW